MAFASCVGSDLRDREVNSALRIFALKTSNHLPRILVTIKIHGFNDITIQEVPENEWDIL